MLYCENCHKLCEDAFCPDCGNESLREVKEDDYCYLTLCHERTGDMLKSMLSDMDISCILLPYGDGVRNALGLSLGGYKVYVPYLRYEESKSAIATLTADATEELRGTLLANRDRWQIRSRFSARRLRKLFGLSKKDEILPHIGWAVERSPRIADRGRNSTCPYQGHDIAVTVGEKTVWFNSVTFEITV